MVLIKPCIVCGTTSKKLSSVMCKNCRLLEMKKLVGNKNPNYRGGNKKCMDCGICITSKNYLRCSNCNKKLVGDKHPHWRGNFYKPCCCCGTKTKSRYSESCMSCQKKNRIKENNPNWRGGITPLNLSIRSLNKYKIWQGEVKDRDNHECFLCHKKVYKDVNIHHLMYFKKIIDRFNINSIESANDNKKLWDVDNGITFCKRCHILWHKTEKLNLDDRTDAFYRKVFQ